MKNKKKCNPITVDAAASVIAATVIRRRIGIPRTRMHRTVATISIERELYREFKRLCREHDWRYSHVLTDLIRAWNASQRILRVNERLPCMRNPSNKPILNDWLTNKRGVQK